MKPAAGRAGIRSIGPSGVLTVFFWPSKTGPPDWTGQPRWTQRFEMHVKLGLPSSLPLFRMKADIREM